jgi:hypothetical protein
VTTLRSAEEIELEYVGVMGDELGLFFDALYTEVAWLHDKWREFVQLFGTSEARIDVLNEAASRFFGALHDTMWEDILLHVSRVSDRAEIGKRTNLTICRLPDLIGDATLQEDVRKLVEVVVRKSKFARDWRNRRIAHRDRSLALGQASKPLDEASRSSVSDALDALDTVIYHVHEHYLGPGLSLDVPGGPGDAADLLVVLQEGLHAMRARDERFRLNQPLPDDLNPLVRV